MPANLSLAKGTNLGKNDEGGGRVLAKACNLFHETRVLSVTLSLIVQNDKNRRVMSSVQRLIYPPLHVLSPSPRYMSGKVR